jgi:hypothetical protein
MCYFAFLGYLIFFPNIAEQYANVRQLGQALLRRIGSRFTATLDLQSHTSNHWSNCSVTDLHTGMTRVKDVAVA